MPNWMLRAILGCCIASLVLNGVVTWIVVSHTRGAPSAARAVPAGVAATGTAAPGATGVGARPAAPRDPFQREWELVDKASNKRIGAVILDDSNRLEEFVRLAQLEASQESALRERYAARRGEEMRMAREMVKQGAWHSEEFRRLQRRFWRDEYRALPTDQAVLLPPSYIPVD